LIGIQPLVDHEEIGVAGGVRVLCGEDSERAGAGI
jgi:hypothetical protein